MSIETELKYLPKNENWRGLATRQIHIRQGYFSTSPDHTMRIRIIDETTAKLTIKSRKMKNGISRFEFEYDIPLQDANMMMAVFCGERTIDKIRHYVDVDGHCWEVDEFLGRHAGLVVAEIELQSVHEPYVIPDWIGDNVTGQPQFNNSYLASNPYTQLS